MADIVIMGMDLGNTMVSCPFRANDGYGDFYCIAGHTDCHAPFNERPEDCKVTILPERHGRLIDVEALGDFPYNISFCDEGDVENWIASAPTIIPAEGGADDDGNA